MATTTRPLTRDCMKSSNTAGNSAKAISRACAMTCVGFQSIVARGAEWAATGKVTLEVPKTFPTADKVSVSDPRKKD